MSRASRGVTSDRPENQKKRREEKRREEKGREGTAMESIAIDRSKAETLNRGPFLPPVERPKGLMMKLAYYFTRRQFGKVLTPLKVHSARLPAAFGLFYAKIGKLDA